MDQILHSEGKIKCSCWNLGATVFIFVCIELKSYAYDTSADKC